MAGDPVERLVAPRRAGRGVAGWIGLADVRFDLDDRSARANASSLVHENLAEEIGGDIERRPIIERARELHTI